MDLKLIVKRRQGEATTTISVEIGPKVLQGDVPVDH